MSDLMLLGVLRMPIDPNSGPVALTQFFARAREAADRIESDAAEIERLRAALAQPPAPTAQPPSVQPTTQALWDACKKAAEAERHACSIAVWMTKMDAQERDADDLGVSGWLEEAERRVKHRTDQAPEAVDSELRGMLIRCAAKAQAALVMGEPSDFNSARPAIAALASFAEGVAYFDAVPIATAQPVQQPGAEPNIIYSPIATKPQADGRHPNDNEPADPDRSHWLTMRGDDEGQGLDPYWKWGHAAGWNDHKKAAPAQRQPLSDEQLDMLAFEAGGLPNSHLEFARAIEAAHGITAAPAAQKGEKL